jgi:hypothetical protein
MGFYKPDEYEDWQLKLKPGDTVIDCRDKVSVISVIDFVIDTVVMEDGFGCSIFHCLVQVGHGWNK